MMPDELPPEAAFALFFPKELLWENSDRPWVSLIDLLAAKRDYEDRFKAMCESGRSELCLSMDDLRSWKAT